MRRVAIVLLISLEACVITSSGFIETRSLYAEEGLQTSDTIDAERERAINIAKEACERERLGWEDVAIRNLGEGRWRIAITSLEQGRTLVMEIDATDGIVLKKYFK